MSYFTNFYENKIPQIIKEQEVINQSVQSFATVDSQFLNQVPGTLKQQCQCTLCFQKYNLSTRIPMNICKQQHHICLCCFQTIHKGKGKRQCPFCKGSIDLNDVRKNRMIIRVIEDLANKKGVKIKKNYNKNKNYNKESQSQSDQSKKANVVPLVNHQMRIQFNAQQEQEIYQPILREERQNNVPPVPIEQNISCMKKLGLFVQKRFGAYIAITYFYLFIFLGITYDDYMIAFQESLQWDYFIYGDEYMSLNQYSTISFYATACIGGLALLIPLFLIKCSNKRQQLRGFYLILYILLSLKFHSFNWIGIGAAENQIAQNDKSQCDRSDYLMVLYLQATISYILNGIMLLVFMCRNCFKCCCQDQ